jgi:cell division protein ZapA (FtsZ GTPase activity inhibitor)
MAQEQSGKPTEYVTVEIYDQTYHLSGQDAAHIRELAALVDAKMRAVAAQGRTVDSLRVAVLAALNLADELSQAGGRRCAAGPCARRQPARAAGRGARGRAQDRVLGSAPAVLG